MLVTCIFEPLKSPLDWLHGILDVRSELPGEIRLGLHQLSAKERAQVGHARGHDYAGDAHHCCKRLPGQDEAVCRKADMPPKE